MKKAVEVLGDITTYGESEDGYEVEVKVADMFTKKELENICQEIANLVNSELAFDV